MMTETATETIVVDLKKEMMTLSLLEGATEVADMVESVVATATVQA